MKKEKSFVWAKSPPNSLYSIAQAFSLFLVVYTRLYDALCRSVGLSVGPSVGPLVGLSVGPSVGL